MRARIALLLVAGAFASACSSPRRDPAIRTRSEDLRDRVDRDRREIDRLVRELREPDDVLRAKRLDELDAALGALFTVEAQLIDAAAYGDGDALRSAEWTLESVEETLAKKPPPKPRKKKASTRP